MKNERESPKQEEEEEEEEEEAIEMANRALRLLRGHEAGGDLLAQAALKKAQRSNDLDALTRAWYAMGFVKMDKGDYHEAIKVAELARQDIAARFGPEAPMPEILNTLGTAYSHLGCYDISITYLTEALRAAELGNDRIGKTGILNNLALTLNELGQYDKSHAYLAEAVRLNEDDPFTKAKLLGNLGLALNEAGKHQEALETLDAAIALSKSGNYASILADANDSKGRSLSALGKIREAEEAFDETLEFLSKRDKGETWMTTCRHRGQMYLDLGRTPEALDSFTAAFQVEPDKQPFIQRCRILSLQAECYRKLGRWKEEADCRCEYMQMEMQGAISRGREKALDSRLAEEQEKILGLEIHLRQRAETILRVQRSFIETLASVTELRDEGTGSHIRRASHYMRLLAYELASSGKMDISEERIDAYITLACLHDIGKVSVSDTILNKPGSLTPEERRLMSKHVDTGKDIIDRMGWNNINTLYATLAKEIIESHHERWDGSGYLRGLKGEEIPLGGRLMAVADVYDALRAKRPYKDALSHDEARGFIVKSAGTQFDPMVVAAFDKLHERFDEVFTAAT